MSGRCSLHSTSLGNEMDMSDDQSLTFHKSIVVGEGKKMLSNQVSAKLTGELRIEFLEMPFI